MKSNIEALPQRDKRSFFSEDFKITTWEALEPYAKNLLQRDIQSIEDMKALLVDASEMEKICGEDYRWRYIKTSVDTTNEESKNALEYFIIHINAKLAEFWFELSNKIISSTFIDNLDEEYYIMIRSMKKEVEIFRKENIEIDQKNELLVNEYDAITGNMSITVDGKEYSFSQANAFLKSNNRDLRKDVYDKMYERESKDYEALDNMLNEMIGLRHQKAINAGYKNFRDYQFDNLGRFDYTPDDCKTFHNSISKTVVPILKEFDTLRMASLGYGELRPWDLDVDENNKAPLKPFSTVDEFINKNIECLNRVDPYFGSRLEIMTQMQYLDVEARKGKANGGYNMSMPEIGVPFVFMNANMTESDIRVMTHEMGHAVHSFLSHPLKLNSFKSTPSEIAELASMSMELFCMDNWDVFYNNESDMKAAKRRHLKGIIKIFSSVCSVDSLQHWMYENPTHNVNERQEYHLSLSNKFSSNLVDWSGYEHDKKHSYQGVLHIYHVPFYYIEYAFAQLGAIAMYKQFKKDSKQAIQNYKKALSLGYTKSIGEIYKTAGIRFDFSEAYVADMIGFLKQEYDSLK